MDGGCPFYTVSPRLQRGPLEELPGVLKYFNTYVVLLIATPALLCPEEPAQGTQSPLRGIFLVFHWVFMA